MHHFWWTKELERSIRNFWCAWTFLSSTKSMKSCRDTFRLVAILAVLFGCLYLVITSRHVSRQMSWIAHRIAHRFILRINIMYSETKNTRAVSLFYKPPRIHKRRRSVLRHLTWQSLEAWVLSILHKNKSAQQRFLSCSVGVCLAQSARSLLSSWTLARKSDHEREDLRGELGICSKFAARLF